MNIFAISGIVILLTNCFLCLLILFKARLKIHYLWILFCMNVALWGLGVYKVGVTSDMVTAVFWWKIGYIGVINIPIFYLNFIFEFLKIKKKKTLLFFYLVTAFFQIISFTTDIFIRDVKFMFDEFYYLTNPSFFYNLFVFLFAFVVVYALFEMIRTIISHKGYHKTQVKAVMIATSIGYCGGVFAFLPVYGVDIYPILNVLVGVFPIAMTYAVLKHKMFDIRFVIQGGIVYSLLLGLIVGFYVLIIVSLEFVFGSLNKFVSFASGIVTVVVGIYTVPIIEKFFRKKTDKIFFKDKYDYSQTLYNLSKILNQNINIESLLKNISKLIKQTFKVDVVRVVLLYNGQVFDENYKYRKTNEKVSKYLIKKIEDEKIGIINEEDMIEQIVEAREVGAKNLEQSLIGVLRVYEKQNLGLIVPIYLENSLSALLMLGKKKSGDSYSSEDYNLLNTFSFQAGVAIEKARLFDEVREYSEELEKKVENRTAEIQGLQEDQRQMIHEMAHGLQTPLTILKSKLFDLSKTCVDGEKIESIEKSIDRVSRLVYNMLRLAKLESKQDKENFRKFNLTELMQDLVEGFEIVTAEKKIKIESSIDEGVEFYGVLGEIEELITNLVSNSVKYIGEKNNNTILLNLKKENSSLTIEVRDTGMGISEENQKHLFERFYRVKSDPSYSIKGTGLGLAIAKKIVEKHDGSIFVESEEGKWTSFKIVFNKNF